MKIFEKKIVTKKQVKYILCNKCGKKINFKHKFKRQDYLDVKKNWGYHSDYDGQVHSFQICRECYKELINSFEIKPKIKKNSFL